MRCRECRFFVRCDGVDSQWRGHCSIHNVEKQSNCSFCDTFQQLDNSATTSKKFRPCPFCGSDDHCFRGGRIGQRTCNRCDAEGPEGPQSFADTMWDIRPLEETLEVRVKGLEEKNERQRCENMDLLAEQKREIAAHNEEVERYKTENSQLWEELKKNLRLKSELAQAKELLADSGPYQDMQRTISDAALIDNALLNGELARAKYELDMKGQMLERMCDRLAEAQAATVQWVTYDGTLDTLPGIGETVLFDGADGTAVVYYRSTPEGRSWEFYELGYDGFAVDIGDRWAYLPQPPAEG